MSGIVEGGPRSFELDRDEKGHRTYWVTHLVRTSLGDGPATALTATGLPQIGDEWNFSGQVNDIDLWAFCWPNAQIKLHDHKDGEIHQYFSVRQMFTTKPLRRCQDTEIEDPLLEPDRISGSFVNYREESTEDRNGVTIKSSSHEIFTGPQVEWDASRPSVVIEQNVADLELETLSELIHKVNDDELWGLAARKVKLSAISWERLWYGVCNVYFTRRLEFDINFNTFDRDIPDQGTKVLAGKWTSKDPPVWTPDSGTDKEDPAHFIRFKDVDGENARTLLDGNGNPLTKGTGTGEPSPETIKFEKYDQDNLLVLGIPTDLSFSEAPA